MIKVNPTEPRYVLRAIAQPGKDIENKDFQILIQIGDEFYQALPNSILVEVEPTSKITMHMEVDLHDMIIDMPATLVDESTQESSKARVKVIAKNEFNGQHALNSTSDIEKVTANDKAIFAKSFTLRADGETNGNNLTVRTVKHCDTMPSCKTKKP